jgi:SAM-dependent methyltransferase
MTDDDAHVVDVDLASAFDAVAADPDGDHALTDTLAPVFEAMQASDPGTLADHCDRLERYLPLATSVLEVAAGTGALLDRLDAFPDVAGVEPTETLAARANGVPVRAGDPTDPPVEQVDAVFAFRDAAGHRLVDGFEGLASAATDALGPGGSLLFDAVVDPVALEEPSLVLTDHQVRVRRDVSVETTDDYAFAVAETYALTDLATDETVRTTRTVEVPRADPGALWDAVRAAGFEAVTVTSREGRDGTVLVVADVD